MAYLPLSTANLPDPVIDPAQGSSPEDYFSADIWSGNSASSSGDSTVGQVISSGFQPDWIWTKERNNTGGHKLFDTVRGLTKQLSSNSTAAEETRNGDDIVAVSASGYTLGTNTGINYNGRTYVGWSWKANGSGVSNTDGSITSTVSANTESGFSVVNFTGTGSNETVGHGLDSAPEMIIFKNRDSGSSNWITYHVSVGTGHCLFLNLTNAQDADGALYFQNTAPTSSVFTAGGYSQLNSSGQDTIAYCFHSVEGFSKFGSYTGNGSADGSFIYTGFRPAFVMTKATNSTQSWVMVDNERAGYNVENYRVMAESSNAESTTTPIVDLLSNGFKWRNNFGNFNGSGTNYIYMAFAENPFKYSNAR